MNIELVSFRPHPFVVSASAAQALTQRDWVREWALDSGYDYRQLPLQAHRAVEGWSEAFDAALANGLALSETQPVLIISSVIAAQLVSAHLKDTKKSAYFKAEDILCIGQKTAQSWQQLTGHEIENSCLFLNAQDLIDGASERLKQSGRKCLYAAAEQTAADLPTRLGARGVLCQKIVTYRTDDLLPANWPDSLVKIGHERKIDKIRIFLFYSRRNLVTFRSETAFQQADKGGERRFAACLSPRIVANLVETGADGLGFARIEIATEPTPVGLISAVERLITHLSW